jgi:hypothetical protein
VIDFLLNIFTKHKLGFAFGKFKERSQPVPYMGFSKPHRYFFVGNDAHVVPPCDSMGLRTALRKVAKFFNGAYS